MLEHYEEPRIRRVQLAKLTKLLAHSRESELNLFERLYCERSLKRMKHQHLVILSSRSLGDIDGYVPRLSCYYLVDN